MKILVVQNRKGIGETGQGCGREERRKAEEKRMAPPTVDQKQRS